MSRDPKTALLLRPVNQNCKDENLIKGVQLLNATDDPAKKMKILNKLLAYIDED